jgi:hypothetical protein
MFTLEVRTGRLIEARIQALRTMPDVDAYVAALTRQTEILDPARGILCADHRPVAIYPPPVADRLAELFSMMNTRLDRIAVIVAPTNATLSMQLQRIVREANNPSRRVFQEAAGARDHLAEVLTEPERVRLAEFLGLAG